MLELFNNPGYFAAGSALVSAPVIIHLINRMRFRRLRWAAMEFLLKAQKRNRRRLIIEQLILLMLRCMLIMLAALLVLRFVGFSIAGYSGQDALHVVILDDTPSMNDQWKEGGTDTTCFKIAKEEVILNNLVKKIAQNTTNERLAILPLSELAKNPDYSPTIYQKLGERATQDEIAEALEKVQATKLHTDLAVGLDRAAALIHDHSDKRPIVHIVSDFRLVDWSGEQADRLKKGLEKLASQKAQLYLLDTAHPNRLAEQGGVPLSHDNLSIVDFKANSRLVGKSMPVTFSITVANHSPADKQVHVGIYKIDPRQNAEGKEEFYLREQLDLNVEPANFKVSANGIGVASFKFTPMNVKEGVDFFSEKFAVHLESPHKGPLEDDGLLWDNLRFASVQIRNKIPILLIDGDGSGSDATAYVETALKSISDSYEISYGDLVTGNPDPTEVLKTANLMNYAAIYLINVDKLTEEKSGKEDITKLKNLENYVKEGGSVAFFLGKKVNGKYYTDKLHNKGKGLFPAPIAEEPTYNADVDPKKAASKNFVLGSQAMLRDDKSPRKDLPIFGDMIVDDKQLQRFKLLTITNHFAVPRSQWDMGKAQAIEVATLPNKQDALAAGLDAPVGKLLERLDEFLKNNPKYKAYDSLLKPYTQAVRDIILSAKSYELGALLKGMLEDEGDKTKQDVPTPKKFWSEPDPKIADLRKEFKDIADQALFGDPFVVTRQFGKGRVVAVMSSAGADWNDWGYGLARDLWPLFHKYALNYMFDQTTESSLVVGSPYSIEVKPQKYQPQGVKTVKMIRTFYDAKVTQQVKLKEVTETGILKDGLQTFFFKNNYEDGFYVHQLLSDETGKKPLETYEHVFNLDTKTESKLQRISPEEARDNVLFKDYGKVKINDGSKDDALPDIVNKQADMSDSPWFYLVFLLILVTEQALAVHLSYHLRGSEGQLPAEAMTSQLKSSAAQAA